MKLRLTDGTELAIKKYPQPKRDATRKAIIAGHETPVRITGGGKFPVYSYFAIEGASYYVKHDLADGATADILQDAPKTEPAKTEPAKTEPTTTEAPKLTRAQRRAAKAAAK